MIAPIKKLFLCCFIFQIGVLQAKVNPSLSEDPKSVTEQLQLLQKERQKLETVAHQHRHQEKTLTQQLASVEMEMGEQAEQLRLFDQKRIEHQKVLNQLQNQTFHLKQTEKAQVASLTKLIQATYYQQRKEKLQLLLAPKEWANLSRINQFYRFFYDARANEISSLQQDLAKLQDLTKKISKEHALIESLASKTKEKQFQLQVLQTKRKQVLTALSQEKNYIGEKLSLVMQQEQQLEEIFKRLGEKVNKNQKHTARPVYIEPQLNFAKMKHQLSLPIQVLGAKLSTLPHLKDPQSKKTYIEANAGTPVNAIFGGKVVFAEWLRGVGLLVILDHGNGYLSLYGNNEKLYKSLGEWVNQGEMIARVGQSGGHAQPGLYFEIRKNGEALDPTPWFNQA